MSEPVQQEPEVCGIVMPISAFGDYAVSHWSEVRDVIGRASLDAGLNPIPVWEHSSTDIIQGRIVQNLYNMPIVVCDISGLNPNVMFELGLRLAFKKPIVLIVDQSTNIPFDTNSIEHIVYDGNLHYQTTEKFINELSKKITSTLVSSKNPDHRAFIDTFGTFSYSEPNPERVSLDEYILDQLIEVRSVLDAVRTEQRLARNLMGITGISDVIINAIGSAISQNPDKKNESLRSNVWTQENINVLKEMWSDGATASDIAQRIGGVSKNSVFGKAHRLGLSEVIAVTATDQLKE